ITLGTFSLGATASIHTPSVTLPSAPVQPSSSSSVPITVSDTTGPDNTPAQASDLTPNTINLNYLINQPDLDYWQISVPAPAQLALSLSTLPPDFDLVLYSPSVAPLRGQAEQTLAPVSESTPSLTPGADSQSPVPSGDVPLDRTLAVYAVSANRGT